MGPLLVLGDGDFVEWFYYYDISINICVERVGRKDPQDLTQFSPRSHPRHLMGKRTAHIKTPPKASQENHFSHR